MISLGLTVIADGVETKEQRDFLAHQGLLFDRPGPVKPLQAKKSARGVTS